MFTPGFFVNIDTMTTSEALSKLHEGFIKVETSVGSFIESIPVAWGWKNGERIHFTVRYKNDHGRLSFESEIDVNTLDSLVIDPQLIFTSFSGSLTDNWGFTATYDDLGRLYGGGISFSTGYVSTVGAYQVGYNDPPGPNIGFIPDVTISVFAVSLNNNISVRTKHKKAIDTTNTYISIK